VRIPTLGLNRATFVTGCLISALLGGIGVWLAGSYESSDADVPAFTIDRQTVVGDPWTNLPEPDFSIPPYAKHLKDVVIVLDPGHGGRSDRKGWKRGPTGLREEEVNLRVAQFLRVFLEETGAKVVMTRDRDVYLRKEDDEDLDARAAIANELVADLFLSIHHNASDKNPNANYSMLFYHGAPEENPVSVNAARFIYEGLTDALRLEQQLDCGAVSDLALFPNNGLRVLRMVNGPAVLSEGSFHSNPAEEQRLRDPEYNRREAYGLFIGLAHWAQAGLPRVRLVQPDDGRIRAREAIVIQLDDGLSRRGSLGMKLPQLVPDSILVGYEGEALAYRYDADKKQVTISPTPRMARNGGNLYVDFTNLFGQHVLHPWIGLGKE
jgi:N-acetylmuramoyl-L-alanine amidase